MARGNDLNKPKLLFVGAFPPPHSKVYGGQVTSCRALIDSTFSQNFNLLLLDTTQIANPLPGIMTRAFLAAKRLCLFFLRFHSSKPDAVLLFAAIGASLIEKGTMARYARICGVPVLLFPRGAEIVQTFRESKWHRIWIRWALTGADMILCQGPTWQRFVMDDLGYSQNRAPIVANWTAKKDLISIGDKRSYLNQTGLVRFLFLGWVEREKGVFELLEACSRLAPSRQFSLTIAGRGTIEEEVLAYIKHSSLARVTKLTGWLQGEELCKLLSESDVLILPSWAEGFPNAIIEAMAAGLAVVVTTVGNVPDILKHEQEALMVPPKDSMALERALLRIIDDENFRHDLSRRGHIFAKENFAVEPAARKLSEAIMQAIAIYESRNLGA